MFHVSKRAAILSGKWHGPRPFVSKGPLKGSYVFTQCHFHWGKTDSAGSEHTVRGKQYPLELHLMFFKSSYMTQEEAKKHRDGIVLFAYFFKISRKDNSKFSQIISALDKIKFPNISKEIDPPFSLSSIVHSVSDDYFLYLGEVYNSYRLLCFVSRKPLTISSEQLAQFRTLYGVRNKPLLENCRPVKSHRGRSVLLVNPDLENPNLIGFKRRESEEEGEEEETLRSRGDKKRSKFTGARDDRILMLKESLQELNQKRATKPEGHFYPPEIFEEDLQLPPDKSVKIQSIHVQFKPSHPSRPPEVNEDDILPESATLETPDAVESPKLSDPHRKAPYEPSISFKSPMDPLPPSQSALSLSITSTNAKPLPSQVRKESHKKELDEINEKIRKFKEEDTEDNMTIISDVRTPEEYKSIHRDSRSHPSLPGSIQSSRMVTTSEKRPKSRNEEETTTPLTACIQDNRASPSNLTFAQDATTPPKSVLSHRRAPLTLMKPKPALRRSPNRARKMTPVREIFNDGIGLSRGLTSELQAGAPTGEGSVYDRKQLDKIKPWK